MKELSIEEKAKAYDEAKLRMSAAYNSNRCTIGFMNEIFPELKESEDERTWIINYLSNRKLNSSIIAEKENLKKVIAWLEKQGKNNMGISEAIKQKLEDNLNKALEKETPKSWNEFLEKQGEPIDRIVKRAMTEKQRVLLTETNGDANIDWDTRSLQDVKLLLEYGLDYIKKLEKQGEYQYFNDNFPSFDEAQGTIIIKKHDENKPIDKIEPKFKVGDTVKAKTMNHFTFTIKDITDKQYVDTNGGKFDIEGQDYLELVEQKPADKVEPKFHEGEWLCENELNNYARFVQILEIVNVQGKDRYRISRDIHKDEDVVEFGFVEKYYHKFDIQDAKDGDVLCCESGWTCIFKALNSDISFSSYCFMDADGWFCENGSECHTLNEDFVKAYNGELHPATKEQREQLEKAMADVGYTFDFEKKELKKIKRKPAWSEEDENVVEDIKEAVINTWSGDTQDIILDWLKFLKYRVQPKQEWTEEDEKIIESCIFCFKQDLEKAKVRFSQSDLLSDIKEGYEKKINWLKSLKGRVYPKQEWSEEDETRLMNTIIMLKEGAGLHFNKKDITKAVDWLKSLHPQNRWKPSEEQLTWLYRAADMSDKDSRMKQVLNDLLSDLKKLREE